MPEFQDFKTAFQWWLDNVYPTLPSEEKEKIKYLKYNFLKGRAMTKDKIEAIIKTYSKIHITINIEE